MVKRKIVLGNYDTAANGWTLAKCQLSKPVQKTKYVEKSGGDGSWDLSTALSDGIPKYKDRTLTVTLECSEGTRLSRKAKIDEMINTLDGMRLNIELPDDPYHYITGRLSVEEKYNDLAHAAVEVKATCEPWKFANEENYISLGATSDVQTVKPINNGRRAVVPVLTIRGGAGASVLLKYGSNSKALTPGSHQWPDLLLTPGAHDLTYSGDGVLELRYREAVL